MPNQFDFCNRWVKQKNEPIPSHQEFDQLFEQSKKKRSDKPNGLQHLRASKSSKHFLYLWGKDKKEMPCLIILLGSQKIENQKLTGSVHYAEYVLLRGTEKHCPSFPKIKPTLSQWPKMDQSEKQHWLVTSYEKSDAFSKDIQSKPLRTKKEIILPYFEAMTQEAILNQLNQLTGSDNVSDLIAEDGVHFFSSISELFSSYDFDRRFYPFLLGLWTDPRIYMRKKYLSELIKNDPPKQFVDMLFSLGSSELIAGLFLELANQKKGDFLDIALLYEKESISWANEAIGDGLQRCAAMYRSCFLPKQREQACAFITETIPSLRFPIKKQVIIRGRKQNIYRYHNDEQYRWSSYIFYNQTDDQKKSSVFEPTYFAQDTLIFVTRIKSLIQQAIVLDMPDAIANMAYLFDTIFTFYPISVNQSLRVFRSLQHQLFRAIDAFASKNPAHFVQLMRRLLLSYNHRNEVHTLHYRGIRYYYFVMHFLFYTYEKRIQSSNKTDLTDALLGEGWASIDTRQDRYQNIWNDHLDVVLDILEKSTNQIVLDGMALIAKDPVNCAAIIQKSYSYFLKLSHHENEKIKKIAIDFLSEKVKAENVFKPELFASLMNEPATEIKTMAIKYQEKWQATIDAEQFVALVLQNALPLPYFENMVQQDTTEQFFAILLLFIAAVDEPPKDTLNEAYLEILALQFSALQDITTEQQIMLIQQIIQKIQGNIHLSDDTMNFLEQVIFCFSWETWQSILGQHTFTMDTVDILPEKNMRLLSLLQSLHQNTIPRDAEISNILLYGSANMVRLLIDIITHNQKQLLERPAALLIIFESSVVSLQTVSKAFFLTQPKGKKEEFLFLFIDSPVAHVYMFALEQLEILYQNEPIPARFVSKLLEHPAMEVKKFVAEKASFSLLGIDDEALLFYYIQNILFSPNRLAKSKEQIYLELPLIAMRKPHMKKKIESLLFSLTDSSIRRDSDHAFVALAKIKAKENV